MSKNTQISELINYISVDGSGNVVFTTVPAATTNTNKFLVSDAGTLKFRTAAQLLSDIGAQASGSYQAALSGTGFVKISGSTISYDNSTYLTTSSASSTYLPLSGGTLTGPLIGTSANFSTVSTDYVMTLSNVNDSSQGLLVRATDNDSSLFLLKLQSSNGATSQTWVDRFTVAKNGETTISSTAYNVTNFNSSYGQANINIQNGGTTFAVFGSGASTTSTAGPNDVGIGTGGLNNAIVFATGTGYIERVRITNGGYLGIGSNNPARILYTVGVSGGAEWVLEDTGSSINQKKFNVIVSGNKTQFRVLNDANNGGTVWLTTDNSNGFVGIGSIAPARRLTVQGADDGVLQIRMQGTADTTSYCEIGREAYSTGDFRINVSRSGTVINALKISDTTGNATFSRNIGLNSSTPRNYFYSGVNNAGVNLGGYTDIFALSNQSLYIGTNMYYDNGWFRPNTGYAAMIEVVGSSGAINFYNQTTGTGGLAITPNPTMVLSGVGNLGVGTITPSGRLGVQTTGADGLVMEPDLGSVNNSGRLFFKSSVQTYGLFNNSGDLRLTYDAVPGNTSGTSLARFTNTGKYFRMEAGTGGIQFNGNTGAANALNAYEEGTWTPVISCGSGGASYNNQLGWYTKIGRLVTITWFIAFTKGSLSGGTVGLAGFPFSLRGGTFYPQATVLFDNLTAVTNNITLQGDNNASTGTFIENNGGTTDHAGLATTRLGSGTMACRGTLTYFTA